MRLRPGVSEISALFNNGLNRSSRVKNIPIMKINRITRNGERREALLKEYFLTASLIALLKRVGEEAAKAMPSRRGVPVLAKIRR